jgi:ankyrin repeat protein
MSDDSDDDDFVVPSNFNITVWGDVYQQLQKENPKAIAISLSMSDNHEQLQSFLQENPNLVNYNNTKTSSTLIHHAAYYKRVKNIEVLVSLGCPHIDTKDNYGATPLWYAAYQGSTESVETLVRLGSTALDTPNNIGETPFLTCIASLETAKTILRLGSQHLDTPCNAGETPMHEAAVHDSIESIEFLVQMKCTTLDARNKEWRTPLHEAASEKSHRSIIALVRFGSDALDSRDANGSTPLHYAAARADFDSVYTIMRLGSLSLDAVNNRQHTPLHYALAKFGAIAEVLLHLGANRDIDISHDTMSYFDNCPVYGWWENALKTMQEQLERPVDEDAAYETRYIVYFSESLTSRLLFNLERTSHLARKSVKK